MTNRPSLAAIPFQARIISGYDCYAVDFVGNVWSCKGGNEKEHSNHWRKLQPISVQGQLAVQLTGPKMVFLVAELVLTHFGYPKPSVDSIVRYLGHRTNCSFDAIHWDLPTDDEISEEFKRKLREEINKGIEQHALRDQRKWHHLANQAAGIRSQNSDDVTVQELHSKLDYLKKHLFGQCSRES